MSLHSADSPRVRERFYCPEERVWVRAQARTRPNELAQAAHLLLSRVSRRVLDMARNLLRRALRFVHFAFGFHLFVAGDLASLILYRALHLLGGPFHVFLIHVPILA